MKCGGGLGTVCECEGECGCECEGERGKIEGAKKDKKRKPGLRRWLEFPGTAADFTKTSRVILCSIKF